MTPPPGSPVNDFEDTHVMETRHPLTIPAAMVVSVVSAVVVAVLVAEVVDQWTAVDAGVGVVCSSFGLVGARRAGSRSIRRSS